MRTGWVVNLLLLIGVAGLAAYAIWGRKAEDPAAHPIATLPSAQVDRIAIELRSGTAMRLEKQGEDWYLTQPLRARADRTQVDRVLDLLGARSEEKLAAVDLQRFDLDAPAIKVSFNDHAIAFGTTNPLTHDQYVLSGDGVYLLSGYFAGAVPQTPSRILTHALLRPDEKPTAFLLKSFRVEQRDGGWRVDPPPRNPEDRPSQDDINRWVDEWRYASSLLTQPASGKPPAESISLRLADGRTLRLAVAQREPELVLVRPDEKLAFHFSGEVGRRLLGAPAASEKPPPENPAVETPAASGGGASAVVPQ
jgi:hypothetical protein